MNTMDAILARRSIRKYEDREVEKEKITRLLEAAMAAPSAMNIQSWEFVVITEPENLAEIRSISPLGKYEAPAAIIVCGNTSFFKHPMASRFWVQDACAATQNILISAVELGLGTVWVGIHPIKKFTDRISKMLNLPNHVFPLNIIFIGYPAEKKPARTQFNPDRVHWEMY